MDSIIRMYDDNLILRVVDYMRIERENNLLIFIHRINKLTIRVLFETDEMALEEQKKLGLVMTEFYKKSNEYDMCHL